MQKITCASFSDFLDKFNNLTKRPTRFLSAQAEINHDVKLLIKSVYDFTKSEEKEQTQIANDALPELIVDEFDEEQIWQEIELQNTAQWNILVENVAGSVSNEGNLQFPIKKQPTEEFSEISAVDVQNEHSTDQNKKKSKRIIENNESKTASIPKKKKVKSSIVDDEFFNLNEMEKFLDQEDKRDMFEDKLNKGKLESDEDSIDLFEDDSELSDEGNDENDREIKYKDFFECAHETIEDLSNQGPSDEENSEDEDEVSEENTEEQSTKKSVRFNLADSESNDDDDDDDNMDESAPTSSTLRHTKLSEHEMRQERLRQKIYKLEQKNLAEKPWQLKGEVDASSRPQNSLLEEVIDFDLTARPAPTITEETTLKLEDIIHQRIKDKVWDDVERKAKPVPETHQFRKVVILDQEKSKVSLADVYEQEYLKQKRALTGDEETAEQEPEEHKQIKKMMERLFTKLDALSNYHYTPKPAQAEVKIVSNIPAISMEEVAPVATSDAALLAPEEVKAKSKGDLMTKSERTETDKKRERRKKKKVQREKQNEKEKKDKMLSKLNPGLGNKYSKDKASKILDKVTKDFRNTDKMTQLNETKVLKSSKAFFTQLNDDITTSGKSKIQKNKILLPAKKYKL